MKCKRCYGQTDRSVTVADRLGNIRTGCPSCIYVGDFKQARRVRTNRKIHHAYEVYGVEKTKEMNQRWFKGQQEKAKRTQRANACISEGAFKVLEEHTRRGLIRPRENGRPVR